MTSRGRYLALEGVEGAGKSTVAAAVADRLRTAGRLVVEVREPGGTWLGEEIRRLLLHSGEIAPWSEAMLFAAQRAQLVADVVGPALATGSWVVSDRSYYSSLAYQGGARGLGVAEVREVNEAGLAGVVPDLVVVLDVDPATGLGRQDVADRIGGQGLAFQESVASWFRRMAVAEPDRMAVVDARGPVDAVVDAVMNEVWERWPA